MLVLRKSSLYLGLDPCFVIPLAVEFQLVFPFQACDTPYAKRGGGGCLHFNCTSNKHAQEEYNC